MFDFLPRLDAQAAAPLYAQLVAQLRGAILEGSLAGGEKLPSTRGLAERLGVSRTTVTEAYAQLIADGYLMPREGSGTYVSGELPAGGGVRPRGEPAPAATAAALLSAWGRRLDARSPAALPAPPAPEIDFKPSAAAWDAFPHETWRRLAARSWRRAPAQGLGYGEPAGWRPLREAIAAYLGRARGVRCTPDQLVIVNGSQQAVDLLARLCLDPGDAVVVEDPGYPSARRTVAAYGARVLPVPVDATGLVTESLPAGPIKLAYVTPSHQYPTGATLPLGRRLALLRWAARAGALVLEDDYDSEFRYEGRPIESLQGLDDGGRVVYLGTYSKILFPSLRLGYVVLPPALLGPFLAAKDLADRETAAPEQRVLADFIDGGHFERHVRRMRQLYARRRATLLEALHAHARGRLAPAAAQTGMHMLVRLEAPDVAEADFARQAAEAGVGIYPAGNCWHRPPDGATFLLGFAGLDEACIVEGVRRLARLVSG